jgi:excisionase family DNA binding protein
MPRPRSPVDLPPVSDLRDLPSRCATPVGDFPYVIAGTDEPDQRLAPVLLTIGEVAARLRMSEKSVRRRIKDGIIHAAPTGGRLVRISSDEVLRLTAGGPSLGP